MNKAAQHGEAAQENGQGNSTCTGNWNGNQEAQKEINKTVFC
jgi:hypothetical protein